MNDREFIESIRSQCDAQLGGGGGGGSHEVDPLTSKPANIRGDLGKGYDAPLITSVLGQEPNGYTFHTRDAGPRSININAKGPVFWRTVSWAVFDSGGTKVMGDVVTPSGTLGWTLDSTVLAPLAAGEWTLGVAVDASGSLALQYLQQS